MQDWVLQDDLSSLLMYPSGLHMVWHVSSLCFLIFKTDVVVGASSQHTAWQWHCESVGKQACTVGQGVKGRGAGGCVVHEGLQSLGGNGRV